MNKAYTILLGASATWMLVWGATGVYTAAHAAETDALSGEPLEFDPQVKESKKAATWHPVTFSVYATRYHGRTAANGKRYDHRALTCASNSHKFGTRLELRYKGMTVTVTVTDRMDRRLGVKRIDLSGAAFKVLNPAYDMTDRTGTLLRGEWRVKP
jgi:rare lipoprotein A (peptidoglycan hydrolase)